jgi:NADH:flavin oxidoreductases, Old Yellow Enzyme family
MTSELRSLFSPIQVGRLTLKNRIYSSAHAEAMAEGGRPGERLRRYHEAKARGGCALTILRRLLERSPLVAGRRVEANR